MVNQGPDPPARGDPLHPRRPSAAFGRESTDVEGPLADDFDREWPACWETAASLLEWHEPYDAVLDDDDAPFYRWFVGGRLNAAENCVDRHLESRQNQVALRWEGKRGERRAYTYLDLYREVNAVAAALRDLGVEEDDVVTFYLPNLPALPIGMLACARIGAHHNVVFAGFAPDALADRMDGVDSSVLVTCDGHFREGTAIGQKRKADAALAALETSIPTIVVDRLGPSHDTQLGDDQYDYDGLVTTFTGEEVEPVPRAATDPLFHIHTSGTTGEPQRMTHATGGYLAGTAWTAGTVFDLSPGDTYWCTADVGWITGHSYVVYGPLARGATVVLAEGSLRYPDRHRPWEVIERNGVEVLYTTPGTVRTFAKWGESFPAAHDLCSLRLLGTVGEPIGPDTWEWYYTNVGGERCPIVDTWWQTETGSILLSTLPGTDEMKPGSVGPPLPGIEVGIVDEHGRELPPGEPGYLTIERPWPSMLSPLEGDEYWVLAEYWQEFSDPRADSWSYFTGDRAVVDDDGYVRIIGRDDDVVTVGNRRLGTAELEAAITAVDGVTEAAAVAGTDGGDTELYVFATVAQERRDRETIREAVADSVAERVGEFVRPGAVVFTPELPETHSGKTMYRILERIVEDAPLEDSDPLRNPEIVGELATIWARE
ncbi:acetate--CoA ligase [Natrarchaeobaculum sulfurireducens]|uniref:acetate--CoA ligase n=1 Tax=Natrarchaeobaculum sulfurireducens TaxID=2044521 RepID=A0A346PNB7_9EURY|nr:acetate--CoA ligase [Natrarchaeobaculum sulfurireducens]AXR78942.1 Acyl-coenzyme A synthetase/AMP-(fatty) acid ligase [Natrarchaeobaculum sulfurireducens]AXR81012.1 Acetyl-coenzyme A synthetase [Natrarchaeobaculum sulfurireducens]